MHRRTYLFAMSCLTFIILGCGDTPHVILRDAVTSWNELADTLYEIPDDPDTAEEVAGQLVKRKLKALKEKFDEVKKRTQKFQKADKDERGAVNDAIENLHEEAKFAGNRLAAQAAVEGRLRAIIAKVRAKTGQPTPNLETCASIFTQFAITLPSDEKKFPAAKKFAASWNLPGTGQGGGGMPGMPGAGPGGRGPGMPGGMPGGMPKPPGP
jgi:hypothetical protein